MLSVFFKSFSALGLAFLIYFALFQQACSQVNWGAVSAVPCSQHPEGFNCKARVIEDSPDPVLESPESPLERKVKTRKVKAREPAPTIKEYEYDLSLGKVDVLFVIDNSSSMAYEHRSMAKQFSSFLDAIRDLDYHIALITTDISNSPENPHRDQYFQDGKFIPIKGQSFLRNQNLGEKPDPSIVSAFKRVIQREETTQCDQKNQPREARGDKYDRLYAEMGGEEESEVICPSSDERGTYALNMAFTNPSHSSFFREDSQMIVVFLSDEDVRSGKEFYNQPGLADYTLEYGDKPESVLDTFFNVLFEETQATKYLRFHSIIIPPGDSHCLQEQNRKRDQGYGTGRGYYGEEYARLSRARKKDFEQVLQDLTGNLLKGSVISICDRNYANQLKKVAISAKELQVPLACENPQRIKFFVNGSSRKLRHHIEGKLLYLNPGDVTLSSRLKLTFRCQLTNAELLESL